jgi:hypothetical protein
MKVDLQKTLGKLGDALQAATDIDAKLGVLHDAIASLQVSDQHVIEQSQKAVVDLRKVVKDGMNGIAKKSLEIITEAFSRPEKRG